MRWTGLFVAVIVWSLAMNFIFDESFVKAVLATIAGSLFIALTWAAFIQEKE